MRRRSVFLLPGMIAAMLLVCAGGFFACAGSFTTASCEGKQVYPGSDLAAIARDNPQGTTFCLHDGLYEPSAMVVPKQGQRYSGIYSDGSKPIVDGRDRLPRVFDIPPEAPGVALEGITITGSTGGDDCEPGCGSGVKVRAIDTTMTDVRLTGNPNQGAAVQSYASLTFLDGEVDNNGSYSFTLMDRDDGKEPSASAGIKSIGKLTVRRSHFHHNYWNQIWCDELAGPLVVTGSTVEDGGKTGIQFETCHGPSVIRGNTVQRNGNLGEDVSSRRGGILLLAPRGIEVADNTVSRNQENGILVKKNYRQEISRVSVHHNTLRYNTLLGCSLGGVRCEANVTERRTR